MIGLPHLHLHAVGSTSDHARALAEAGAPHGTLVSAATQTSGRGRQGRSWSSPAGVLAQSFVLRAGAIDPGVLPLAAAVAVAELCGPDAQIKWPNDVWLTPGRKVAGILIETRAGASDPWYIVGIGINVAVRLEDLDPSLAGKAATMGEPASSIPDWRRRLTRELTDSLAADRAAILDSFRARDGLLGREIEWDDQTGVAEGIDDDGRLLARTSAGELVSLLAGEVHLGPVR